MSAAPGGGVSYAAEVGPTSQAARARAGNCGTPLDATPLANQLSLTVGNPSHVSFGSTKNAVALQRAKRLFNRVFEM